MQDDTPVAKIKCQVKDYVNDVVITRTNTTIKETYKDVDFYFENDDNKEKFLADKDTYFSKASEDFRFCLNQALDNYMKIQVLLAADKTKGIKEAGKALSCSIKCAANLKPKLDDKKSKLYSTSIQSMKSATDSMVSMLANSKIKEIRKQFGTLSTHVISYCDNFNKGETSGKMVHIFHCPMALGNGASWIQGTDKIANPYFGSSMLRCGSMTGSQNKD